jgi:pilus assembly protein Flp/PilA
MQVSPLHTSGETSFFVMGVRSMKLFRRFLTNEDGATAIEYALIAAVIGLGILTGAQTLKNATHAKYTGVSTSLNAAN